MEVCVFTFVIFTLVTFYQLKPDKIVKLTSFYKLEVFLTFLTSNRSPRVRERSPTNVTSSKICYLSGFAMSAFLSFQFILQSLNYSYSDCLGLAPKEKQVK